MRFLVPYIIILPTLWISMAHAQIEILVEEFLNQQVDEEINPDILEENLIFLKTAAEFPIDLNALSEKDLGYFFFLTEIQKTAFINYRKEFGPFIDLYEIQAIPHFDAETCLQMANYVTLNRSLSLDRDQIRQNASTIAFLRWDREWYKQKGFETDPDGYRPYLGDPNRLYFKFNNHIVKKYSFGFNFEKDAGEQFILKNNNSKSIDHFSFHLALEEVNSKFEKIIIGDYYLNLGQGLTYYTGYAGGKGSLVNRISKNNITIAPFKSQSEYIYFRGATAQIRLSQNWIMTPFVSKRKRDGNVILDSLGQKQHATSLYTSGLHRSSNEIQDAKQIDHAVAGISLRWKNRQSQITLNTISHLLSPELKPRESTYNQFYFRGNHLNNTSVDFRHYAKNLYFFGEVAVSNFDHWAAMVALQFTPDQKTDLSILFRSFAKAFNAIQSRPFAENSGTANEYGLYISAQHDVSKRLRLSAYVDAYRHPWQKYQLPSPSSGIEYLGKLEYVIKRKWNFYAYWRRQNEEIFELSLNSPLENTFYEIKNQWRLHLAYQNSPSWEYRLRAEWKSITSQERNKQRGYLVYAESIYQPLGSRFTGNLRLAYFKTENYDTRIYTYERNVYTAYAIPSFYGNGIRTYFNLRYKIPMGITVEIRLDFTKYFDRQTIGSGNNVINGQRSSKSYLQLIYRL